MDNRFPRVSVVMPVYNAHSFLAESIESVLSQTYTNFEFFIVDDGSTDDSLKIIRTFAKEENRIVIIENSINQGQSISLNKGIKAAKGEFIAIMDADDISLPTRFETQVNYFDNHPEIEMCGTAYREFANENIGNTNCLPKDHKNILSSLLFFCPFTHSTVMFRRKPFVVNSLYYDPVFRAAKDFELWSRALFKICSANIEDDLLRYRIHCDQISQNL